MNTPTEPVPTCFHCGLPNPEHEHWALEVEGKEREFCCPGCREVCRSIMDAGLGEYYQLRESTPDRPLEAVPAILKQLELYDHPEIQKSFVTAQGDAKEAELMLENIRCPACIWVSEQRLRQLDGVLEVDIDYVSHRARVVWDPDRTALSCILQEIAAIGYIAHPYDPTERRRIEKEQSRRDGQRLLFAGLLGMPTMNFAFATYVMGAADAAGNLPLWVLIGRWTSLLTCLAILAYSAQDFFVGAWRDLRARRIGMDVPIVIGLLTALAGSVVATVEQRGEVYYDSIAMFVFFVLTARFMERKGILKAADALDRLARIVPRSTLRLRPDGSEERIAVVDLKEGDRVRLLPGETVPADGVLIEGSSGFDESLLSGESLPVDRGPGDAVRGGTLNVAQPCVMEVTGLGAGTALGNILRLVHKAQREKPRVAVLAERTATWFVAIELLIGLGTAVTWALLDPARAVHNTVAVLIVTCPCALALATPAALVIAAGRFVEFGALALRMDAVETLARIRTLVFDKTGTLTYGKFRLERTQSLEGLDAHRALALGAALEQGSEHPLALPFRGQPTAIEVDQRRNHPGAGVSGTIDGMHWKLGKPEFAWPAFHRPETAPGLKTTIATLRERGLVVLLLADGDGPRALFALSDTPRPGAKELVETMHRHGVRCAILSGDHTPQVRRMARTLGIEEAHGDLLPADKLAWIRQRKQGGEVVGMVGDGVNDAPTLAAADCAIAMHGGTDLAQSSSGFILLRDELPAIAAAYSLSRRTRGVIRQNLIWAAAYNLCAIPLAAMGYIPPWGAAIGMSLSSLLVVGNALRLSRVAAEERVGEEGQASKKS